MVLQRTTRTTVYISSFIQHFHITNISINLWPFNEIIFFLKLSKDRYGIVGDRWTCISTCQTGQVIPKVKVEPCKWLTSETPQLAYVGEMLAVFCEFSIYHINAISDSVFTRPDCIPQYHPNKYLQPTVDTIPHKHVAVDLTHWPRKTNVYTVTKQDKCVRHHQARNICTKWPSKTNVNMITKEDLFISEWKWYVFMSCNCTRFFPDQ